MVDEITIKYNNNHSKIIQIFGSLFVKNNKDKCKITINGKESELKSYYNFHNENNLLEINLKGISKISNMSTMFYECESLLYISDIS